MIRQTIIPAGGAEVLHGPVHALRVVAFADGASLRFDRGPAVQLRALVAATFPAASAPARIEAAAGAGGALVIEYATIPGVTLGTPSPMPAEPVDEVSILGIPTVNVGTPRVQAAVAPHLDHDAGQIVAVAEAGDGNGVEFTTDARELYRVGVVGGPVRLEPGIAGKGEVIPNNFVGEVFLPPNTTCKAIALDTVPLKVSVVPVDGWIVA